MPSRRPWFRLYTTFRTDPRIRGLSKESALAFVNLLCLAGESSRPGHIELSPGMPYSPRSLADAINVHPCRLNRVLDELVTQGVGGLTPLEDGTYLVGKWGDNQKNDPTADERMVKLRQKQTIVTAPSHERNTTVTVTGESRVEKNKSRVEENPPTPLNPPRGIAASSLQEGEDSEGWQQVRQAYEQNIAQLTPRVDDLIKVVLSEGISPDWVVDAIYEAVRLNHRSWGYIEGILRRWREEGRSPPRPTKDQASKKIKKGVPSDREREEVPDGWTVIESYPGQEDVPEVPE